MLKSQLGENCHQDKPLTEHLGHGVLLILAGSTNQHSYQQLPHQHFSTILETKKPRNQENINIH